MRSFMKCMYFAFFQPQYSRSISISSVPRKKLALKRIFRFRVISTPPTCDDPAVLLKCWRRALRGFWGYEEPPAAAELTVFWLQYTDTASPHCGETRPAGLISSLLFFYKSFLFIFSDIFLFFSCPVFFLFSLSLSLAFSFLLSSLHSVDLFFSFLFGLFSFFNFEIHY